MQSGEEELFEAGRFDDAADLMARSWLVGPERERDQVDAALYDRVCQMVLRSYKLQAEGGDDAAARRDRAVAHRRADARHPRRARLAGRRRGGAAFRQEMPDAREAVVDGCAHLPTLERPDEVAHLILDFLSERGAEALPSARG